jgi:DNA-binding MarR family transcriptional regulator
MPEDRASQPPTFTALQGQYLTFLYASTQLNRRPPAERDFQEYFQVTAPSVHQMILTLERLGFIRRTPGLLAAPKSYNGVYPLSHLLTLGKEV